MPDRPTTIPAGERQYSDDPGDLTRRKPYVPAGDRIRENRRPVDHDQLGPARNSPKTPDAEGTALKVSHQKAASAIRRARIIRVLKQAADQLPGGLADLPGAEGGYDGEELSAGRKVEMEHTSDPEKAEEIAKDHLEENPEYYSDLEEMEDEAKMQGDQPLGYPSEDDLEIIQHFLATQSNLDDDAVHQLMMSLGVEPHEGEEHIYAALQDALNGQAPDLVSAGVREKDDLGEEPEQGPEARDMADEDRQGAEKNSSKGRCWKGYEPVPGKEPYSEDSCRPKKGKKDSKMSKKSETQKIAQLIKQADLAETLKSLGILTGAGGALGGTYGAMRDTNPGEGRVGSILRNTVRGAGTAAGGVGGAYGGSALAQLIGNAAGADPDNMPLYRLLGGAGGGLLGAILGNRLPSNLMGKQGTDMTAEKTAVSGNKLMSGIGGTVAGGGAGYVLGSILKALGSGNLRKAPGDAFRPSTANISGGLLGALLGGLTGANVEKDVGPDGNPKGWPEGAPSAAAVRHLVESGATGRFSPEQIAEAEEAVKTSMEKRANRLALIKNLISRSGAGRGAGLGALAGTGVGGVVGGVSDDSSILEGMGRGALAGGAGGGAMMLLPRLMQAISKTRRLRRGTRPVMFAGSARGVPNLEASRHYRGIPGDISRALGTDALPNLLALGGGTGAGLAAGNALIPGQEPEPPSFLDRIMGKTSGIREVEAQVVDTEKRAEHEKQAFYCECGDRFKVVRGDHKGKKGTCTRRETEDKTTEYLDDDGSKVRKELRKTSITLDLNDGSTFTTTDPEQDLSRSYGEEDSEAYPDEVKAADDRSGLAQLLAEELGEEKLARIISRRLINGDEGLDQLIDVFKSARVKGAEGNGTNATLEGRELPAGTSRTLEADGKTDAHSQKNQADYPQGDDQPPAEAGSVVHPQPTENNVGETADRFHGA